MNRHPDIAAAFLLAISLSSIPALAITHTSKVQGPAILAIAKGADSVHVIALDPAPIPGCEWRYPDSLRFSRCYEQIQKIPAPSKDWSEELGELLARTDMRFWDDRCGYSPFVIVRFVEPRRTSDLVVLIGKCDSTRVGLFMVAPGVPVERREVGRGQEAVLELMDRAFALHESIQQVKYGAKTPVNRDPDTRHAQGLPKLGDFVEYDEPPVPVTKIEAIYPEFAKEAQITGKVVLHVLVGTSGRVKNVRVMRGVTGLNEAAIDAVKKWVFIPAKRCETPVAVWVEIPIDFHR